MINRRTYSAGLEAGYRAQDFRASRARAVRRREAGEHVVVCARCRCELDVARPAHDLTRCRGGNFTGRGERV